MSRRPPASSADYMIVAINPALIMLLVGSVLFFLCEVFYRGQYEGRLTFICAMYVMGIVAVSRISMEEGAGYAAGFGAPLAGVVYLAFNTFVTFHGPLAAISPLLNAVFLLFTWWLAYRLTWDCTLLDDNADASGQGLLEAAGFDIATGLPVSTNAPQASNASSPVPARDERPRAPMNAAEKLLFEKEKYERERLDEPSFIQRWFEADRRPRAQGVWVLWFAAIALPIFGVMQWFVPSSEWGSRVWCLQLLLVYVGSSLALLLNTSFLSLRRYLRQRKLEMPLEMAGVWMIVGAVLIGGVMLFCLVLPRPGAEVAISQPPITFGNSGLTPSRWGIGNDGNKQQGGSGQAQPNQQQGSAPGKQSSGQNASQSSSTQGSQPSGSQSSGSQKSGSQSSGSQSSGSQSSGAKSQSSQQSGSSSQNPPPQSNSTNSANGQKSEQPSAQNQQQSSSQTSPGQQTSGQSPNKAPSNPSNSAQQPMPGSNSSQPNSSQPNSSQPNSAGKSPEGGSKAPSSQGGDKSGEKTPSGQASGKNSNNSSSDPSKGDPSKGDPSKGDPAKSDPSKANFEGEKDPSKTDNNSNKSPEASKTSPDDPAKTNQNNNSNSGGGSSQNTTSQPQKSNPQASSGSSSPSTPPRQSNFRLPSVQIPASLGNILKLLLWAAIAVGIVYCIIRYREQLVAAWKQLLDELAKLWARLFGGGDEDAAAAEAAATKAVVPPRPFASYMNPFTSGLAARMPPPQLMGHTLGAAEAFGRERGFPRDESETPHEYLARLFQQSPEAVQLAMAFAETYGQVAFGKGAPPQQAHATSKHLWQVMSSTPPPPPPMANRSELQTAQR